MRTPRSSALRWQDRQSNGKVPLSTHATINKAGRAVNEPNEHKQGLVRVRSLRK
ncbi:hypothetical protein HanRHA438_Chr10g0437321 [Helianthus annuus]|nr:hypothetical protein HanRHA438_Chr10g0437321 [Helianthus annuus]